MTVTHHGLNGIGNKRTSTTSATTNPSVGEMGHYRPSLPEFPLWDSLRVPTCPPQLRSSDISNHPTWTAEATVVCVLEEAPHCNEGMKRYLN